MIRLPTLRFLICGSGEDGSTLIDRLLLQDSLRLDDKRAITQSFSTPQRSFIVTECGDDPVRNMVAVAGNCDLAVLLVDAREGLPTQTLLHAHMISVFGVRHLVLAVDGMDLVDDDRAVFAKIVGDFASASTALPLQSVTAFPLSSRPGDSSAHRPWHQGPGLLAFLETVEVGGAMADKPLRFAVQGVSSDDRGAAGALASGRIAAGDEIVAAASGKRTRIARMIGLKGELDRAEAPDAVTLVFTEEIKVARGDLLCDPAHRPDVADQFAAHVIWMCEEPLLPGRSYLLKSGDATVSASVTEIKYRRDVAHGQIAAKTLELNDIGFCNLALSRPIAFDAFADNRVTGAFSLIDRANGGVAAAGIIAFALRRASNIHLQALTVDKTARAALKQQKPVILWFTGLSGAGKSTIANLVEARLLQRRAHSILLDGDNVRHGLNKDLGFTEADRVENIRRVGEVAKLLLEGGLIALCAFISPFAAERRMVRERVGEGEFIEIFVDTPLSACIARDPKGLYKKALAGQIKNFTGVDQPYERPEGAEITIGGECAAPEQAAERIVAYLEKHGVFGVD